MSVVSILAAFAGGVFACLAGASQTFVFAGFLGLVGMVYASAMNLGALASTEVAEMLFPAVAAGEATAMEAVLTNFGPINNLLAFGPVFGPGIAFVAPLFAGAYARYKNYIGDDALRNAQCWVPLVDLKRVDVMLVGGLGGVFGHAGMYLIDSVLKLGIDSHATMIVIACLLNKLIFEHSLISPMPEDEKKAYGSRFHPACDKTGWLPYTRKASVRLVFGLSSGVLMGYLCKELMSSPISFAWAHCIGFFLGGSLLILLSMGFSIIPFPPAFVPACFGIKGMIIALGNTPEVAAALPAYTFMIWGAAFGTLGIFMADFMIQTFEAFGRHYIDPPGSAIMIGSFIALTVVARWCPQLAQSNVFPIALIVVFLLYTVMEEVTVRRKSVPAEV